MMRYGFEPSYDPALQGQTVELVRSGVVIGTGHLVKVSPIGGCVGSGWFAWASRPNIAQDTFVRVVAS